MPPRCQASAMAAARASKSVSAPAGRRADVDPTRQVAPVDQGGHDDNRRDNRDEAGHAGREPTMPPAPGPRSEGGEVGLTDGVGHHIRPECADHARIRHDLPQCARAHRAVRSPFFVRLSSEPFSCQSATRVANATRPRESRDFTVPSETLRTLATSSMGRSER